MSADSQTIKETPITSRHIELGAKMASFSGYNMPISYTSIKEEHKAVREGVGVFDVSHMGQFIVRGKDALPFLQKITTNDVSKLEIGEIQYSCMPNMTGGIMDDLLIYRLSEENCSVGERAYMMVVNAGNIEKNWAWVSEQNNHDIHILNISQRTGLLAVQGPKATAFLQEMTDIELSKIKYYNFVKGDFAGMGNVIISATGYTGSGGFEIYVNSDQLPTLWDDMMKLGKNFDLTPCGLGARDTLRLEMGYCLYGNDIDETTSPIEAGLSWITKFKKGEFNSSEIFAKHKEEGVSKKLMAFIIEDRRVPRTGYAIEDTKGNKIGEVTSGTMSPSLGIPIGMGYVDTAHAKVNNQIRINTGKKHLKGELVKTPFLKV